MSLVLGLVGWIKLYPTYHRLIKALDGSAKMTKRAPASHFTLNENPETAAKKISNAFTGGQPTVKKQREVGANPSICPIYDLYMFHFFEKDEDAAKLYNECRTGKILCGECKNSLIEVVTRFVQDHQRKRLQFIDKGKEILERLSR